MKVLVSFLFGALCSGALLDGALGATVVANDFKETRHKFNLHKASSPSQSLTMSRPNFARAEDVTKWLTDETNTSDGVAFKYMMNNISPEGSVPGVVISSTSRSSPNYYFHWLRDAALTMDYIVHLYQEEGADPYENMLWEYTNFTKHIENLPLHDGLGDTKFNTDGSSFDGFWCRPQTDGAALTALTLIRFASAYLDNGGSMARVRKELYDGAPAESTSPIKKALDFVVDKWRDLNTCDIWEEVKGDHFYTRMVQRRALIEGSQFANRMRDFNAAKVYAAQVPEITTALEAHWDERRGYIVSSKESSRPNRSGLDSSVILGVIHSDAFALSGKMDSFSPADDRVLATIPRLVETFSGLYPIARIRQNTAGLALGPALGRYPEDTYDGTGSSRGNPWFVCTSSLAEFYYRLIQVYKAAGKVHVSPLSLAFFNFIGVTNVEANGIYDAKSPQFLTIVNTLSTRGDEMIRRVLYHSDNGRLREQFNRNYGFMQGAVDVTWAYDALLTAALARSMA